VVGLGAGALDAGLEAADEELAGALDASGGLDDGVGDSDTLDDAASEDGASDDGRSAAIVEDVAVAGAGFLELQPVSTMARTTMAPKARWDCSRFVMPWIVDTPARMRPVNRRFRGAA